MRFVCDRSNCKRFRPLNSPETDLDFGEFRKSRLERARWASSPRPVYGERIEVRGMRSPFSQIAPATKMILREPRSLATQEGNRCGAHSLATFAEPKFCRLQISTPASFELLHTGFLLSCRKAGDRVGRWRG